MDQSFKSVHLTPRPEVLSDQSLEERCEVIRLCKFLGLSELANIAPDTLSRPLEGKCAAQLRELMGIREPLTVEQQGIDAWAETFLDLWLMYYDKL
jgi:hypothetical protein